MIRRTTGTSASRSPAGSSGTFRSDEYYDLYVLPVRRDGDKVIPLTDAGVAVSYFRDMNGNGAIDREDEGTLTPLGGNGFYDDIDDLSALMEILDGKFAGEE